MRSTDLHKGWRKAVGFDSPPTPSIFNIWFPPFLCGHPFGGAFCLRRGDTAPRRNSLLYHPPHFLSSKKLHKFHLYFSHYFSHYSLLQNHKKFYIIYLQGKGKRGRQSRRSAQPQFRCLTREKSFKKGLTL